MFKTKSCRSFVTRLYYGRDFTITSYIAVINLTLLIYFDLVNCSFILTMLIYFNIVKCTYVRSCCNVSSMTKACDETSITLCFEQIYSIVLL